LTKSEFSSYNVTLSQLWKVAVVEIKVCTSLICQNKTDSFIVAICETQMDGWTLEHFDIHILNLSSVLSYVSARVICMDTQSTLRTGVFPCSSGQYSGSRYFIILFTNHYVYIKLVIIQLSISGGFVNCKTAQFTGI
jgi:hypothetical protein